MWGWLGERVGWVREKRGEEVWEEMEGEKLVWGEGWVE